MSSQARQRVILGITGPPGALDDEPPWPSIRDMLTDVWYLEAPRNQRHRRLVARHIQFGKSPEEAQAWVSQVDEANAQRIERMKHNADFVVTAV